MKADETLHEGEIQSEVPAAKTSPELADELRFAPLANLKGRAISVSAAALVAHLAEAYPRTTKNATRSNKPRKLEPQVHAAIGAFLADLLMAQGNEDGAGWLRLSLDKKGFKKPAPVSWRMFDGLRTAWNAACQSAFKFDPASASNFDPFGRRVLAVALAPSELVGVAETVRARAA